MLKWAGSHVAIVWSPDGKFLISGMQENALHGWRVADEKNMRMGGYPTKVKSLAFMAKGNLMATSGANGVVVWPFAGVKLSVLVSALPLEACIACRAVASAVSAAAMVAGTGGVAARLVVTSEIASTFSMSIQRRAMPRRSARTARSSRATRHLESDASTAVRSRCRAVRRPETLRLVHEFVRSCVLWPT